MQVILFDDSVKDGKSILLGDVKDGKFIPNESVPLDWRGIAERALHAVVEYFDFLHQDDCA